MEGTKDASGLTLLNASGSYEHLSLGLLDALPFYVLVVGGDHKILFANKAVGAVCRIEPARMVGQYCPKVIHGLDGPFPGCPLEEAVQSEQAVERELHDPSGRWFRSAVYPTSYRALDGRRVYLHLSRDITELKDMEKDRDNIQAQLFRAQKMEAVGLLAAGVAHDFNNWLTVICGRASLALLTVAEGTTLHQELRAIAQAAERATELAEQLLVFARRKPIDVTPLDLNAVLQKLADMLRHVVGKDVTCTLDLAPDLRQILGNSGSIEQVIMNLAINAKDAMPEGGVLALKTENVSVGGEYCAHVPQARVGQFICLAVEDTGTGMEPEIMQHLFEPFFTTKQEGKGTGLGLATVYAITTRHEGWITVDSEVGRGTVFKLYLPAVPT